MRIYNVSTFQEERNVIKGTASMSEFTQRVVWKASREVEFQFESTELLTNKWDADYFDTPLIYLSTW